MNLAIFLFCSHAHVVMHGKAQAAALQQDRAMEFLQGSYEQYSTLCSQISLMESFLNVTKIYSVMRQEEK